VNEGDEMTAEDFRKLADAATPGEWYAIGPNFIAVCAVNPDDGDHPFTIFDNDDYDPEEADCAFIAACGTERQRIHRALLLLEMVEKQANAVPDPHFEPGRMAQHFPARLDAASKEMETRP